MNESHRWVLKDGARWCAVHQQAFGLLKTCPRCEGDPGPEPTVTPTLAIVHPPGCPSANDIRRHLMSDYEALGIVRDELLAKPNAPKKRGRGRPKKGAKADDGPVVIDTHIANAIAKLASERTKIARALIEAAERFEDDAYTTAMIDAEQRRTNGGSH